MLKITLCLLFLVMSLVGYCAEEPQISPNVWDFGKVKQGEVLKHEFVFKNDTLNTLNIKELHTSCGCTVSKVKKKTLLPGESTLIEVTFNTEDYLGLVEQFVYVHTDNLDNPIIRYIIKAKVVK